MARADPKPTRRPLATAFKASIYVALIALLALIVAVAVAYANLPSYSDLSKRSDLGQMIRVRAANGAVLVNIGPSFGQWLLRTDTTRDARRDDRRRGQALPLAPRR
jgi:penicillin-binding protein 1A